MQLIKDKEFEGERPLFASHDLHIDNVTIGEGESAIKECSNILATKCRFRGKYPFWHVRGLTIENCRFEAGSRAALWYSDNMNMRNTVVDAPKMFREMDNLVLENCTFDASCDRAFEYSTLNADIRGEIVNIKNPASGRIVADSIGSVTIDENIKAPADCVIETRKHQKTVI
mgnify:CR=1 FL=1